VAEAPTRILVALDARPESLRSLERTVALAAELGAEIAALFIEDEELMRLCDLPVVEVTLRGGTVRRPEAATLRREVRARASAARKALERAAVTRRVAWSFQITRGRIREEVGRGSPGTDVVTLRRSTRWRRRRAAHRCWSWSPSPISLTPTAHARGSNRRSAPTPRPR
jgi:hypothetical protein